MPQDINDVSLLGNLVEEPKLRYTGSGTAVCNLRMATTSRYQSGGEWQEKTTYHTLVAWGDRGERMNELLSKGARIFVKGEITTNSWEDNQGERQYRQEIKVRTFSAESRGEMDQRQPASQGPSDQRRQPQNQGQQGSHQGGQQSPQQQGDAFEPNDELPF